MIYNTIKSTYLFLFILSIFCDVSCKQPTVKTSEEKEVETSNQEVKSEKALRTAADRTAEYIPLLKGKKIAIVANQTSVIQKNQNTTQMFLPFIW